MHTNHPESITRSGPSVGQHWRYLEPSKPAFEAQVFDEQFLAASDLLEGAAAAGRGNTFFFMLDNCPLVLRHYRRGGLIRHISSRRYVYTGLAKTRAMREFDVLMQLQQLELPAPVPYACQVVQHGLSYEASLITHRIAGDTLTHQLLQGAMSESIWHNLGATLAKFHRHGVFHADLNAHNIMIDEGGNASLIDFDRARMRALPATPADSGWCNASIERLERSLRKIAHNPQWEAGFAVMRLEWAEALQNS